MSDEVFTLPCHPRTMRQWTECDTSGTSEAPHARHTKLTELAHFSCNCGYSSGWVPAGDLPLASDFIQQHLPDRALLQREEKLQRMLLGCTCHE